MSNKMAENKMAQNSTSSNNVRVPTQTTTTPFAFKDVMVIQPEVVARAVKTVTTRAPQFGIVHNELVTMEETKTVAQQITVLGNTKTTVTSVEVKQSSMKDQNGNTINTTELQPQAQQSSAITGISFGDRKVLTDKSQNNASDDEDEPMNMGGATSKKSKKNSKSSSKSQHQQSSKSQTSRSGGDDPVKKDTNTLQSIFMKIPNSEMLTSRPYNVSSEEWKKMKEVRDTEAKAAKPTYYSHEIGTSHKDLEAMREGYKFPSGWLLNDPTSPNALMKYVITLLVKLRHKTKLTNSVYETFTDTQNYLSVLALAAIKRSELDRKMMPLNRAEFVPEMGFKSSLMPQLAQYQESSTPPKENWKTLLPMHYSNAFKTDDAPNEWSQEIEFLGFLQVIRQFISMDEENKFMGKSDSVTKKVEDTQSQNLARITAEAYAKRSNDRKDLEGVIPVKNSPESSYDRARRYFFAPKDFTPQYMTPINENIMAVAMAALLSDLSRLQSEHKLAVNFGTGSPLGKIAKYMMDNTDFKMYWDEPQMGSVLLGYMRLHSDYKNRLFLRLGKPDKKQVTVPLLGPGLSGFQLPIPAENIKMDPNLLRQFMEANSAKISELYQNDSQSKRAPPALKSGGHGGHMGNAGAVNGNGVGSMDQVQMRWAQQQIELQNVQRQNAELLRMMQAMGGMEKPPLVGGGMPNPYLQQQLLNNPNSLVIQGMTVEQLQAQENARNAQFLMAWNQQNDQNESQTQMQMMATGEYYSDDEDYRTGGSESSSKKPKGKGSSTKKGGSTPKKKTSKRNK